MSAAQGFAIDIGPLMRAVMAEFPSLSLFPAEIGKTIAMIVQDCTQNDGYSPFQVLDGLNSEMGLRIVVGEAWSGMNRRAMGCV